MQKPECKIHFFKLFSQHKMPDQIKSDKVVVPLETKIRLIRRAAEKLAIHLVQVPRMRVVIALISLALLFVVLLSAEVIVDLAPQPAAFNESCV
jgi:hypothetical protein